MKRESIIKLMWISLGIHVGHFSVRGDRGYGPEADYGVVHGAGF